MKKGGEDIILMCKQGEKSAEKALFSLFLPNVLGICKRYALNDHDADDLAQDTFIKVFAHIKTYDPVKGTPKSWIGKICINTCLMYLRHARDTVSLEEALVDDIIDEVPIEIIHKEDLLKAIRLLPSGYKAVLNLYVFEEWSHKEIASHLNISESTSRSQLTRAKNLLKIKFLTSINNIHEKRLV